MISVLCRCVHEALDVHRLPEHINKTLLIEFEFEIDLRFFFFNTNTFFNYTLEQNTIST